MSARRYDNQECRRLNYSEKKAKHGTRRSSIPNKQNVSNRATTETTTFISTAPTRSTIRETKSNNALHDHGSNKIEKGCLHPSIQPKSDILTDDLRNAIRHMVSNISKSFIVDWYTSISPTNHDFVASCEHLIEESLSKLAELFVTKLDKYKLGQLITSLLHDHILNGKSTDKITSIEHQIENFEYDICQNSVVRFFGLLSNDTIRRVVFTTIDRARDEASNNTHSASTRYSTAFTRLYGNSIPSERSRSSSNESEYNEQNDDRDCDGVRQTTSALYTLVIAMLTNAAFMPIIDNISDPKWLFAVIIWLCKKEEREKMSKNGRKNQSDKKQNRSKMDNMRNFTDESSQTPGIAPQQVSPVIVTNSQGCRSLDLEEGFEIASTNINFQNPICDSLKRPLDNIEIYSTQEVKSDNSCYVLYCIRYDGLCYRHPSAGSFGFIPKQPSVPIVDKRGHTRVASTSVRPPTEPETSAPSTGKSFRRVMTIKRRFREFVLLQLKLEENPKIRPYLKNIPKPTKLKAATQNIFSLPGITNIKLDQSTIKLRQRFLERFLNALNSSPFIANSYEFKEFFSYNVNQTNTISKSKSTILQVNLNKVFVDSVRSAFSIIRSTLPGDDIQSLQSSGRSDPDAWLTELQQSSLKLHIQTRTSHSKMNLERLIDSNLLSLNDSPFRSKGSSLGWNYRKKGPFNWMGGSRGESLKAYMFKSNSSSSADTNSSPFFTSRSSSTASTSQANDLSDNNMINYKMNSSESVYHDAISSLDAIQETNTDSRYETGNAIQICDSVPIATKIIDVIHYSINGDPACSQSYINYLARILLGRTLERYAIQFLEKAFTLENAALCIDGVTSSIWNESDDPPLDMDNASLEEAATHLARLIELNYDFPRYIPKQLLMTLINKQLKFYLSQIESKKRNKFVIYSFFVHLLDELEITDAK